MQFLTEQKISCPYCGETMSILLDPQEMNQEYIEDCQVCCRPINVFVTHDFDGEITVEIQSENEV
jgi:hypothetical protein